MHALVIDQQIDRLNALQIALMDAGLQVTGSGCVAVAETCLSRMPVDILVVDRDTLGDALGDVIGTAEDRNEHVVTMLRSPDVSTDMDTLAEAFPSLHAILGHDLDPGVLVLLGLASLHHQQRTAQDQLIASAMSQHKAAAPAFQRSEPINAAAS